MKKRRQISFQKPASCQVCKGRVKKSKLVFQGRQLQFFRGWDKSWIGPWLRKLLNVCFAILKPFLNFNGPEKTVKPIKYLPLEKNILKQEVLIFIGNRQKTTPTQ